MHTKSIILHKPASCPLSRWQATLSAFFPIAAIELDHGMKSISILAHRITENHTPDQVAENSSLLFHMALQPDTPLSSREELFSLLQKEHDLILLSLTNPTAALKSLFP